MRKLTTAKLRSILADHKAWLVDDSPAGDPRRADLRDADLIDANLIDANLSGADLSNANLTDADLSAANLSAANLTDADLSGAVLIGADLSGATLPDDVPIVPHIDAAILAEIDSGGGWEMGAWHTCETTHCRGGWAITLAGEAGRKLEERIGVSAAAALIYAASRPDIPVPDFYTSNEEAMADLRRAAAADPLT